MISSRSLRYVFIWGIAHMRYDFLCSFPYICIYCNLDGLSISSHQSFTLSSHSCDENCPKCPQVTLLLHGNFNSCSIKHFLGEFQQCFRFQIYPSFFFSEIVDIFCHFETNSPHQIWRFFTFPVPTTSSARGICLYWGF